jgi:hypothetical protein
MKRISLSKPVIAIIAISVVVASCSKSPPPIVAKATKNSFEDSVRLGEVVPLASGGAYLVSMSNVYYISGEKAVAVSGLPAGLLFSEVEPLADGTAILKSQLSDPPNLYLLRASKAMVISETTEQLTGQAISSNQGFLFATNQRLRRALKVASAQVSRAKTDSDFNYDPEH